MCSWNWFIGLEGKALKPGSFIVITYFYEKKSTHSVFRSHED